MFFFLMIRRPPRSTRTDHSFPTRRSSDLGSYVSAETELFRIADPSVVQAEVSVPVSEGAHIKPGAPAVIEAEGNEISARVRSVTPSADPESRPIQVVLTPTSGGSTLTAGQFIRARRSGARRVGKEGVSTCKDLGWT